jgi:hypothetical protein
MFDQELLATVSCIKHFSPRLEGRPFQLWTDHKPLIALNRVSPLAASSNTLRSFQNTQTSLCMC